MKNQGTLIGIAVGVGLIAAVGVYLFYINRPLGNRLVESAEDLADEYKGKYNSLKQKAKKEYKNMKNNGEEYAHDASGAAKGWMNDTDSNL